MIPTSFSGTSPPPSILGGGCGGGGSFGSPTNNSSGATATPGNLSALLGIASLILEGRALGEEDNVRGPSSTQEGASTSSVLDAGRHSPKPSTSRAAVFNDCMRSTTVAARSSWTPPATGTASNCGQPRMNASSSPENVQSHDHYYSNSSSESAASSVDSNHSRWTQKLSQLRQESPSASHQHMAAREPRVAVECLRSTEPEYVALAINTEPSHEARRPDFEIIRRITLNSLNMQPQGGDNFMSSLQSLASNTCLRVGAPISSNPLAYASGNRYLGQRATQSTSRFHEAEALGPRFVTPPPSHLVPKASTARIAIPAALATPPCTGQNNSLPGSPTSASCSSNAQATRQLQHRLRLHGSGRDGASSSGSGSSIAASASTVTSTATSGAASSCSSGTSTHPQQGPHCDQFLRKMGLAKGDASESEEHHCDMSYVNITCNRWRAYCMKIENILALGEPICIEVYLGPSGHKMLLEQWIITVQEKQPPPTMTLPSLCSAIRSQLYFSQISAWCDLIKKSDKTIYDTGRLIFSTPTTTSAAGDLATTSASINAAAAAASFSTSPSATAAAALNISASASNAAGSASSGSSSAANSPGGVAAGGCKRRPPRLNIFYRIKPFDSSTPACFNSKPNVHNFPNVNVTENFCVSVCLRSLPRITGGIPKISTATPAQATATKTPTPTPATPSNTTDTASAAASASEATTAAPTKTPCSSSSSSAEGTKLANETSTMKTPKSASSPPTSTTANTTTTKLATAAVKTTPAAAAAAAPMICDKTFKEYHHTQQRSQSRQQHQQQHHEVQPKTAVFNANHHHLGRQQPQTHPHLFSPPMQQDMDQSPTLASNGNANQQQDDDADADLTAATETSNQSFDSLAEVEDSWYIGDGDCSNSSFSTNNANLSHREKQLLKYRKRMLRRDKKQRKNATTTSSNGVASTLVDSSCLHMEQGDDEDDIHAADQQQQLATNGDGIKAKAQRQLKVPNSYTNASIPCTTTSSSYGERQEPQVKMISTGTQTMGGTCASCGHEKAMVCLQCQPLQTAIANGSSYENDHDDGMDTESADTCSISSTEIIHTPRNKAELLLQAIQRTPKTNKKLKKAKDLQQPLHAPSNAAAQHTSKSANNNNHQARSSSSSSSASSSAQQQQQQGCQVCKRQKTQHNFQPPQANGEEIAPVEAQQMDGSSNNGFDSDVGTVQEATENEQDGGKMSGSEDWVDNALVLPQAPSAAAQPITVDVSSGNVTVANDKNHVQTEANGHEIMEEEFFISSTKLTPHIERCSLVTKTFYSQAPQLSNGSGEQNPRRFCATPPLQEPFVHAEGSVHAISARKSKSLLMNQFKTPSPSEQHINAISMNPQPHKQTPKPNLLQIACNNNGNTNTNNNNGGSSNSSSPAQMSPQQQYPYTPKQLYPTSISVTATIMPTVHNPLLLRRNSPKVNLTPIFCSPSSMAATSGASSPIPIGNGMTAIKGSKSADIHITAASPTFSFESPSAPPPPPSISVQKSNSAPTLPNSPSLSPRFIKAAALYKRRSRHLSDRSERSSLGSDEQISDEDIDSGMCSPFAMSPVKLRSRLSTVFGRKPLLGNLEESLLQRRLVPKVEVMGFKLLLGASGGFCPTQLTIPVSAYFYELQGETLSTPYLCDIRLPRKGYNVPRCGTVQATLLNPMGTVVRMFVIPYDMRDMPALHQTFIRQRILADTGGSSKTTSTKGVDRERFSSDDTDAVMQNGNAIDVQAGGDNVTINASNQQKQRQHQRFEAANNKNTNGSSQDLSNLGHFISAENMKSLRYSIHLRFQTSRSGRLMLHTDIRLLISRRTDCDTAAAHAKGVLEAPNELITNTVMPTNPKYSARQEPASGSKI